MRNANLFFRQALNGMFKNRLMTFWSVLMVSACSLIIAMAYMVAVNVNFLLARLESAIGISVIVDDSANISDVQTLNERLRLIEGVTRIEYISRDDAFRIVSELYEHEPGILDGVSPDIFPRIFSLEIAGVQYHESVIRGISQLSHFGVENVRDDRNIANAMRAFSDAARLISLVLLLSQSAVSIFIITNTIRITVNARNAEIKIMKLVGATDWYIRWPFIIEGILIGIIGAALPVPLIREGYLRLADFIIENPILEFVEFVSVSEVFSMLIPMVLGLGAIIGTIGSVTSVTRYLDV